MKPDRNEVAMGMFGSYSSSSWVKVVVGDERTKGRKRKNGFKACTSSLTSQSFQGSLGSISAAVGTCAAQCHHGAVQHGAGHGGSDSGSPSLLSVPLGQGSHPLSSLPVLSLLEHAQLGNPEKNNFFNPN